jgi:hypothetical protein
MPNWISLRRGNWIIDNSSGNFCVILEEEPNYLIVDGLIKGKYRMHFDYIKGIELTRVNISLCGFQSRDEYYERKTAMGEIVYLKFESNNRATIWKENDQQTGILYIHQLQNKFFLMTNEEISPNLVGS